MHADGIASAMIISPFTWSLDGILFHLVTWASVSKLKASRVFYFLADYEENTNRNCDEVRVKEGNEGEE
jgi:hypothetical protein